MERFVVMGLLLVSVIWAAVVLTDMGFILFHVIVTSLTILVLMKSIVDDFRV